MIWSTVVRQTHRWTSIVFTIAVILNVVVMSVTGGQPPAWITYSPLPPLFLLLGTGLVMFVLPYLRRRSTRNVA